jgi:serine/threonine protein kinase
MQLCLKIFGGSNPLMHALEFHPYDNDMIDESPEFRKILESCFLKDYTLRPTAAQLFDNPFFAEFTTE